MWNGCYKGAAGLTLLVFSAVGLAGESPSKQPTDPPRYEVQPGDVLEVSVWQEKDLQGDVVVEPDGTFSFPLVGEVSTNGKTVGDLRKIVTRRITKYVPDAVVTVAAKDLTGNKIYVIGKVNKPGAFRLDRYVDVMQALSMAGGTTPYAAVNDIKILRRVDDKQVAIPFRYGDVADGDNLKQNQFLKSGDVIVVP